MGASQSSEPDGEAGSGGAGQSNTRRCYYEILEVDTKATDDEIKKAYRRKALELHPDRNFGNVEAATAQFADVQSAYEVLSDPQERAWYDTHREAILSDSHAGESPSQVTTTEDILALLSKFNSRIDYSDKPSGFFGALDDFFGKLAQEEVDAAESEGQVPVTYPRFGKAADSHEDSVRSFYAYWSGFATRKTFSWKDRYRYADAPDRKIRRLMEKENRQFREEGIREFNDAVRSIIAFLKKRDPRYQPNTQSEGDRQKVLRDAASAQAARSRATNAAKLEEEIPEWMKASAKPDDNDAAGEWDVEEEEEVEELECVVCKKTFKSEKQFEAHERSKKHVQAVKQLRRQMQRENIELDLNASPKPPVEAEVAESPVSAQSGKRVQSLDGSVSSTVGSADVPRSPSETPATTANEIVSPSEENNDQADAALDSDNNDESDDDHDDDDDSDDDYASREIVEGRILGNTTPPCSSKSKRNAKPGVQTSHKPPHDDLAKMVLDDNVRGNSNDNSDDDQTDPAPSDQNVHQTQKLGKAKQKKAKKAAAAAASAQKSDASCVRCGATFPSRTKLFEHVKAEGHAQAASPTNGSLLGQGKKGGKKGR